MTADAETNEYAYRGARAMVLLHERHLRGFLEDWKAFKSSGASIPPTDDRDYATLDTLLRHVLGCARRYMVWVCEQLGLPDPQIETVPDAENVAAEADRYLEHVLEQWRTPLAGVPEEAFFNKVYKTWWNVDYCIDAFMEHAVMHPIRHRFQIAEWS